MHQKQHVIMIILVFVLVTGIAPMPMPTNAQESPIKILAWVGSGTAPDEHSNSEPGQIVYLTGDNQVEVLFDLPQGANRIIPCTEQATSSNSRHFAFYAGTEKGSLYLVNGADTPVEVDKGVSAMSCVGMGTFQYSPDSSRFGYIDYVTGIQSPYASGWLYVKNSETYQSVFTTDTDASVSDENVTAFDLSNEALAFVSLFSDAEEAAIYYQANGFPDEVSTLFADDGCAFRNIQITIVNDNTLALVVGQRCTGGNTEWALYTVNISARSTNRTLVTGDVIGSYYAVARSNATIASPDGETLYFAYPDGIAQNSTHVQSVDLVNIQAGDPLFNNALMPIFTNNIYARTANAMPVISPDSAWLAVVSRSPDNDVAINVIELDAPELPPIVISAPNRGETVSAMQFTPDSGALLFVIGANNADNNSLFSLDLMSAAESRVMRGRFGQQIIVSPDGKYAAVPGWRIVNAPGQPNYLTLIAVNLETREPTTVFAGATVANDVVSDLRFVYPLSWRE